MPTVSLPEITGVKVVDIVLLRIDDIIDVIVLSVISLGDFVVVVGTNDVNFPEPQMIGYLEARVGDGIASEGEASVSEVSLGKSLAAM